MPYTPMRARKQYDGFGRVDLDEDALDTDIADITNPTNLSSSVGESGQNNRRDVAKVETMLGEAGALDLKQTDGPTGYWGTRTADATKKVQAENGLAIDAEIKPNGPTIQKLDQIMGTRYAAKRRKERREKTDLPIKVQSDLSEDSFLKTGTDVLQSQIEDKARQKAQDQLTGTERRLERLKRRQKAPQNARPPRGGGGGGFGGGGSLNPKWPKGARKNRPIIDDWLK